MTLLQRIRTVLVLPILLLTVLTTSKPTDTDTAKFVSQKVFVLEQALSMGQGITTDGTFFYVSGAATGLHVTGLAKIDIASMTMIQRRRNPLPAVCADRGNKHIGGISYL